MRRSCERCGEFRECYEHHVYRVRNNRDVKVWLCGNCHRWTHDNPKQAKKEGFYKSFDSVYRKKKSSNKKWKLNKICNVFK